MSEIERLFADRRAPLSHRVTQSNAFHMADAIRRNINPCADLTQSRSLFINGYGTTMLEKSVRCEKAPYASSNNYNSWLRHFDLPQSERLVILAFKY